MIPAPLPFALYDCTVNVIPAVAEVWSLPAAEILGRRRYGRVAEARKACYLIMRRAGASWHAIARATDRASHQTVLVGARSMENAMRMNKVLTARVDKAAGLAGVSLTDDKPRVCRECARPL